MRRRSGEASVRQDRRILRGTSGEPVACVWCGSEGRSCLHRGVIASRADTSPARLALPCAAGKLALPIRIPRCARAAKRTPRLPPARQRSVALQDFSVRNRLFPIRRPHPPSSAGANRVADFGAPSLRGAQTGARQLGPDSRKRDRRWTRVRAGPDDAEDGPRSRAIRLAQCATLLHSKATALSRTTAFRARRLSRFPHSS